MFLPNVDIYEIAKITLFNTKEILYSIIRIIPKIQTYVTISLHLLVGIIEVCTSKLPPPAIYL